MKKYLILFFSAISIILTVIASGYTRIENINSVKAVRIYGTTATKYLNITGKFQYNDTEECVAEGHGIIRYKFVRTGDYVQQGDAVMISAEINADTDLADLYTVLSRGGDTDNIPENILDKNISVKTYYAPASGVISIDSDVGNIYTEGGSLFSVSSNDAEFEVAADVSEIDIGQLKQGQKVSVNVTALQCELNGYIKEIGSAALGSGSVFNRETTVKVIIGIDYTGYELKRGYTAECRVMTKQNDNVLIVPYSSVGIDNDGNSYVYIADGNKCKKLSVVCGEEYSEGIEIKQGLNEYDCVVFDVLSIDETKENIVEEVMINEL